MKKSIIAVLLVIVVLGVGIVVVRLSKNTPVVNALSESKTTEESPVRISTLKAGDTIESPLLIEGVARGTWFFEASFPVRLVDADGKTLALEPVQAEGEWMTENFVPFHKTLRFQVEKEGPGTLVFEKDNPSGLPKNDDAVRIPVQLKKSGGTMVKAFFGNRITDPNVLNCDRVYPVERVVPKTQAVARAALEEMFAGPTLLEGQAGYFTAMNDGVKIQKLSIANGTAFVDFDETLEAQVGGSCRVTIIRAQIKETLKQFPTVKNVVLTINGRGEDIILQP
ncbi:MAG: GerMN domain-containing protein [bacterium]|nr:GerMN domain-containing protein [bacterium]